MERWGSVVVCRHGIVHMRWESVTLRMEVEDFRSLSALIESAVSSSGRFSLSAGEISVATDAFAYANQRHSHRVGIGSVELLLPADGWIAFAALITQAAEQLDAVLAGDDWGREPDPIRLEMDAGLLTRPHPFSLN